MERLWPNLVEDAAEGRIWAAKAMTATGFEEVPYDEYMIVVYTPNYFETHDVDRVREFLREEYDVTHELYYKPDLYTANGIVAETAAEVGLSVPARYVG
nr:putative phosphothreonine lyase domain-containg protein [Natronobeatus ordinarius]